MLSKLSQRFFNSSQKLYNDHSYHQYRLARHLSQAKVNIKTEKPEWSKAVSEAEKIVGYPTSFMSLRFLLNDEIANVAIHLRKLAGTDHPILKTAKDLIIRNNMPAWGLIVLLISKAAGLQGNHQEVDKDTSAGVLHSQRALAEVTEMIRTSYLIHKGVTNIDTSTENVADMNFGNKIALLSGDFILSKSYHELACLKNQNLNELMSSALRDLVESEFIGPRNNQNIALPAKPQVPPGTNVEVEDVFGTEPTPIENILGNAKADWTLRNILNGASLLGKSCQGTLKLAGHSEEMQNQGYLFGKHLALSWQASIDQEPFREGRKGEFNLVSAPVLFHLEHEPEFYEEVVKDCDNMTEKRFDIIRNRVRDGPGLLKTEMLQQSHSESALNILERFPVTDAHIALKNIITAM